MKFTESHYRAKIKGKPCNKWSGSLPINYGNEKSNPKGIETNIYSTDTIQGCSNNCVGCYAARMSQQARKNFGWIKNVTLKGKPKGKAFLWTIAPNPIPDKVLESGIGVNITVDPMRSKSILNKALRAIRQLGPSRVVVVFKVYPGNELSKKRCLAIKDKLKKEGFRRFIQVVVRLFSKELAKQTGSVMCPRGKHARKLFYKAFAVKGLGLACGSLGNGKCIDCMYCYKTHKAIYRIGTSSDPFLRPKHTVKELTRLNLL